jgi:hypothetical protein
MEDSMAIQINDLRLTFIWTETFFDLLKAGSPDVFPYGFLGYAQSYKQAIGTLLAPHEILSGLTLPWSKPAGNLFWTQYFGNQIPGHIPASLGWEKIVPLRNKPDLAMVPSGMKDQPSLEAYYYPFGTALVVTAYLQKPLSLQEAANEAQMFAREAKFALTRGKHVLASGVLETVAHEALQALREACLGSRESHPEATRIHPLTVATVVHGSGVDPAISLENLPDSSAVQKFLMALSGWMPNWESQKPPSVQDKQTFLETSSKRSSIGDVLYAFRGQNRVVWFPGRFTLAPNEKNSLACYHRNQAATLLHVDSLSTFVQKAVQAYPDQSYTNLPNLSWCVRKSAQMLSDLYFGEGTYKSWSVRDFIDKSDCKPAINSVLTPRGQKPLA